MKKGISCLLVICLLAAMVTGCGSSSESKKNGSTSDDSKITVWVNGGEDAFIPMMLPDFQKEHPEIQVELVYVPQSDCHQKIMTTIASNGELPDIVDSTYDNIGQLKDLDMWENLTADPYNLDTSELADFILPAIQNNNGDVIALPGDNGVSTIVYDRDLAKKYLGTDDPEKLETMIDSQDKIVELAKQVQKESNGKVYSFASVNDAYTCSFSMNNNQAFVEDGKLNVDPSIGSSYKFVADLVSAGAIDGMEQYSDDWYNNFSESTTLFYSCPLWFTDWCIVGNDTVGGGRWGMITPPTGAYEGGEMFLIPKASEDKKKEAAYTFLHWLCATKEGAESWMNNCSLINLYSGNLNDSNPVFQTEREEFGGEKIYEKFLDVARMDSLKVRPVTKYDSAVISSAQGQLPDLAQGLSADEALTKVKDDILSKYSELK